MKRFLPWWAKILLKLVVSRLPLTYDRFANAGLFRHGRMDDAAYALDVFETHFAHFNGAGQRGAFTCLELGPGDSLASALIANAHGASRCYMVDAGAFAHADLPSYARAASLLREKGLKTLDVSQCETVEALMRNSGGVYLTAGLASLREIPDDSVDFIWSQAVLEHVRLGEFDTLLRELQRILCPSGLASHQVDLKDHLGGSLNNLRLPATLWERDWMARSGFYTNRIRYRELLSRFEDAGFAVEVVKVSRWDAPPLPRASLAAEFAQLSDEDLCVSGVNVILRNRR